MKERKPIIPQNKIIYGLVFGIGLVFSVLYTLLGFSYLETSDLDGPSMLPTLQTGDKVLVATNPSQKNQLHYGQLVKVKTRERGSDSMVKRVIGLPGDHLTIEAGKVIRNDQEIEEPYLNDSEWVLEEPIEIVLKENEIYVMGDNRDDSTDSRQLGPINLDTQFEGIVLKKIN